MLLSIFLIEEKVCFGVELKISVKVMICASWSERPFIKGYTEKSNLYVLTQILSIRVLEFLKILVGNFTVLKRLNEAKSLKDIF